MPASHSVAWQGNLGHQNIQVNQSCETARDIKQVKVNQKVDQCNNTQFKLGSLVRLGVEFSVHSYKFTSGIYIAPCFPGPDTVHLRKELLSSVADRHLVDTWHRKAVQMKQTSAQTNNRKYYIRENRIIG